MELEHFLLVRLHDWSAIFKFTLRICVCGAMAHFGETFFVSTGVCVLELLAGSLCLQCTAAVPVRRKTCERCDHVFRTKRKAECNLRVKAMKRIRAVESDSKKSARQAKDKLHKGCERASESLEQTLCRQKQNSVRMTSMTLYYCS